jgi:hypothetical protein
MSGHFLGGDLKLTKRYKLGQVVGGHCRNFLLMTATPHNGHEEDFQLFMALLDGDRFEGRARDGVHSADPSDLMRRMVKEDLVRFDGRPLFPERRSYTAQYHLSPGRDEPLRRGDRLRPGRDEPGRALRRRRGPASGQRGLRLDDAPAASGVVPGGNPRASLQRRRKRLERPPPRRAQLAQTRPGRLVERGRPGTGAPVEFSDQLDDIYEEFGGQPRREHRRAEQIVDQGHGRVAR